MQGIAGKTAIVTGAGRGIGRAIALRLAREGADVCIAERHLDLAQQVADEVAQTGRQGLALVADVARVAECRRLVEHAIQAFGQLDILVNNAGISPLSDPLTLDEEQWDRVQAVNLKGTFFTCQAALPHMLGRGSGRIVNIASVAAKRGSPVSIDYNVSKAGVVTLTRNLAVAYGARGITINCVCPGIVDTAMWADIEQQATNELGFQPGELTRDTLAGVALGRIERPEDVANAVAFLCSDDAAYITGQAINVDGGVIFH